MRITSDERVLSRVGPRAYAPWRLGADFQDVTPPRAPIAGGLDPAETGGSARIYAAIVLGAVLGGLAVMGVMRRRRASGR